MMASIKRSPALDKHIVFPTLYDDEERMVFLPSGDRAYFIERALNKVRELKITTEAIDQSLVFVNLNGTCYLLPSCEDRLYNENLATVLSTCVATRQFRSFNLLCLYIISELLQNDRKMHNFTYVGSS